MNMSIWQVKSYFPHKKKKKKKKNNREMQICKTNKNNWKASWETVFDLKNLYWLNFCERLWVFINRNIYNNLSSKYGQNIIDSKKKVTDGLKNA